MRALVILVVSLFLLGAAGDRWPSSGGGNGGSDAGMFEFCRNGGQGIGYNSSTGRWVSTCGNYNWHEYQDSTQANASYYVDCTGDGTGTLPDGSAATLRQAGSCLKSGEKRLIGALHRVGLALRYTEPGGKVFLPRFAGKDHGIYVDFGCGYALDGTTRNDCPDPYDPAIENDTYFSQKGYHWQLFHIQMTEGRRVVGEGTPQVADPASVTPTLTGVWLVNDRGQSRTSNRNSGNCAASSECDDGPSGGIESPDFWMRVGYQEGFNACAQDDAANNSIACDEFESINFNPDTYLVEGAAVMASQSALLEDWTNTNNFDSICLNNAFGSCSGGTSDGIPCNADAACTPTGGTCQLNRTVTTGTCRGDRDLRCYAASADADAGGCNVDTDGDTIADTDLGPCEGFVDALQYEHETNYRDMQLFGIIARCEPDAGSADDCESSENNTVGVSLDVRDYLGTQCGVNANVPGEDIRAGVNFSDQIEGWTVAGRNGYTNSIPFDTWYYGGAGSGQVNLFVATTNDRMNLRGAGIERVGMIPGHWIFRDSSRGLSGIVQTTAVDAGADTITEVDHGFLTDDGPVFVSSSGTLPSPLNASTGYYIIRTDADTFQLATARTGSAVNITTQGTGNLTLTANDCSSGADESSSSDDSEQCDTQSMLQVALGIGPRINDNLFFNGSSDSRSSNIDGTGVPSRAIVERNTITYNRRSLMSDMGQWLMRDNVWDRNWYTGAGFIAFADGLVLDGERYNNIAGNGPLWNLASGPRQNIVFRDVVVTNVHARSNQVFAVTRASNVIFDNMDVAGVTPGLMDIKVNASDSTTGGRVHSDVNGVTLRNVTIRGTEIGTQRGSSDALAQIYVHPASGQEVWGLTVQNVWYEALNPSGTNPPCLIFVDDDIDETDMATWWISGNHMTSAEAGARIYCYANTGVAGQEDASDHVKGSPSPPMSGNSVNGAPEYGAPWISGINAAQTGDCENHAMGAVVDIVDDTGAGNCADAGNDGILDGGGSAHSQCTCDPSGNSGSGAWSPL